MKPGGGAGHTGGAWTRTDLEGREREENERKKGVEREGKEERRKKERRGRKGRRKRMKGRKGKRKRKKGEDDEVSERGQLQRPRASQEKEKIT